MIGCFYTEDAVVGGDVDLDHDVPLMQFIEECLRIALIHDVYTVSDALGVAELHCLANMEGEPCGWHKPRSQFARVREM